VQTVIDRHGGEDIEVVDSNEENKSASSPEPEFRLGRIAVPAHRVRQEEENIKNEADPAKKGIHVGTAAIERVARALLAEAGQVAEDYKLIRPRANSRAGKTEMTEEEKERDRLLRKERRDLDSSRSPDKTWVQGRNVSYGFSPHLCPLVG
jgi:hypothetical protein